MTAVTVELPAGSDWTSEEVTVAGVTGTTVIYGPQAPRMPAYNVVVYKHTVQIQLLPHAAHEWPVAMDLLEKMCTAAVENPWTDALKFVCYVSRDGRKGVIITEEIIFTDPDGINTLKGMAEHDDFVAWLTAETEGHDSRANWSVSDTPVPVQFV